jgi:replicative DNA helicase
MKTHRNGHRNGFIEATIVAPALHAKSSEKGILASMLAFPEKVLDDVFEKTEESEFYVPAHQEVFKAIKFLYKSHIPIDITTVHQRLVDTKIAQSVGSPGILAEIMAEPATHTNIGAYIANIQDKATRRRVQQACTSILDGVNEIDEIGDLSIFAEKQIGEALAKKSDCSLKTAAQVADIIRDRVNSAIKNKGKLLGVPTGFRQLDKMTNGWGESKLILIAGSPGDGKSVLLEGCIYAAAIAGEKGGVFTLEMEAYEHGQRTVAHEANISTVKQCNGQLDDEEVKRLADELDKFEKLPILYEETPSLNILGIRSKARKMVLKEGVKIIGIDYLNLIDGTESNQKEMEKNRESLRGLKQLARELKVPIIVLAQVNREGAKGEELEKHHIRSAGEDDPDIIILIQREKDRTDEQKKNDLFPTKLKVAKNRGGPTGVIKTILDARHNKFTAENY